MKETKETQNLARLEEAAAVTENPEELKEGISKSTGLREKPPRWWFVPYIIVAAIMGALFLFFEWKPEILSQKTTSQIQLGLICFLIIVGRANSGIVCGGSPPKSGIPIQPKENHPARDWSGHHVRDCFGPI
jgi:hypothetical protein